MRIVIILCLFINVVLSLEVGVKMYECGNANNFSKEQRENLIYAYNFGAKNNLGLIMAAIAWQESCAGAYLVNFSDPSAGMYHAHLPVVIKYYTKLKDTQLNRNIVGQTLMDNKHTASLIALDTLNYWLRYHKGNVKNTIKSYNKGFRWEKDRPSDRLAENYYLAVSNKMKALESYLKKYIKVKEKIESKKSFTQAPKTQQTKPSIQTQKIESKKNRIEAINESIKNEANKPKDFLDLPFKKNKSKNDEEVDYESILQW